MSEAKINEKLDELIRITTRIEAVLYPDGPYQSSIITRHGERIKHLEMWRSGLTGAWALLVALFTIKKFGH